MKGFLIRFLKRAAVLWFGSIAGVSLFYLLSDGLTVERFLEICGWVFSPVHAPAAFSNRVYCLRRHRQSREAVRTARRDVLAARWRRIAEAPWPLIPFLAEAAR